MAQETISVSIDLRGALADAADQLNVTAMLAEHLDRLAAGKIGVVGFLRFYGLITGSDTLDRQPASLLDKTEAEALAIVATWLEDCEDHLALRRTGGLPAAPFNFAEAWVMVRQASLRATPTATDAA